MLTVVQAFVSKHTTTWCVGRTGQALATQQARVRNPRAEDLVDSAAQAMSAPVAYLAD